MADDMSDRERTLLESARAALRWFDNSLNGRPFNGANGDLFIARQLFRAIDGYRDAPVTADIDKRYPIKSVTTVRRLSDAEMERLR